MLLRVILFIVGLFCFICSIPVFVIAFPAAFLFLAAGAYFIWCSFNPDYLFKKSSRLRNKKKKNQISEEEYNKTVDYYSNLNIDELASKQAPILLNKNEYLYYQSSEVVEWYEEREITEKINYKGFNSKVKITKNFSYRAGSIKTDLIKKKIKDLKISGILLLTNQRVIVKSNNDIKSIPLTSIDDFKPASDGILLLRSKGKNIILFNFMPAHFAIILFKLKNKKSINNKSERNLVLKGNTKPIDPIEDLKRYKELLDEGILTQEEFDQKKIELLKL